MRASGACGSKNVGTSNRKAGEKPARRKIKVSKAMVISFGLVGPKEMEKSASDGQQVNIPALPCFDQDRRGDADRKLWSAMVSIQSEGRSGKGNPPGRLPGKASKEKQGIRTTNRHRWTRRIF